MISQTRLDRFFLIPQSYTPSKYSLTDFPPSVRSRIYSSLNLVRDGHIHLNVAKFSQIQYLESVLLPRCWCLMCYERSQASNDWSPSSSSSSILALLLTCRTLYHEICPILYSSNHFTVSRSGPGGLGGYVFSDCIVYSSIDLWRFERCLGSNLSPRFLENRYADTEFANRLFNLRVLALASLTSLTIALNECGIDDPDTGREIKLHNCWECADLEEVDRDDTSETASEECMENPMITRVEFPLGYEPRYDKGIILEWKRLCRHIACCILPNRLRLCLICDVKDVESAQEVIKPMRRLPILSACSIRLSTKTNHTLRCMAIKATHELTGRDSSLPPLPRLPQLPHEIQIQILQHTDLVAPHDLRWAPEQGLLCLSKSPNEKDSVWAQNPHALNPCELCFGVHKPRHPLERQLLKTACASQCRCWRFPTELFLVSSAYHRDATRIFYSSNHFYVYGGTRNFLYKRDMCPRFIQQLPRDARQHLRSIQFLLPKTAGWSMRYWKQDVLSLGCSVELSRLTVTIDGSLWRNRDWSSTEASDKSAWERTQGIVEPFMKLARLKDFYVHLGYPMNEELRSRREKVLERRVMGGDYDSEKRGKYLHRHRVYDP